MPSRVVEALRERLTLRNVVTAGGLVAVLHVVFEVSVDYFVQTGIATAIVGLTDVVGDAYDLRESVQHGGIGLAAIVGSLAMFGLGAESLSVPVIFLVIGTWFVLDAVQTARHEGATKEEIVRSGREVYRDYLARRVHEVLKERPLTRRELHDELDADDESIDEAVERLHERDVVERAGSELRVVSPEGKTTASRIRGLARRIARPLLLELESDRPDASDEADEGGVETKTSDRESGDDESERIDATN